MSDKPTLAGKVFGASRSDLKTQALALAATYFGTKCVAVVLENERPAAMTMATTFVADFRGQEHHDVQYRSYGPGECFGCKKKSWPHDPLEQAKW